jgi:NAD/NADP transhydrogenase alpha subunit
MRAAETLVSGLALPTGLGLLGLALVGLAWLDGYIVEAAWERANQRKTPRNPRARGRGTRTAQPGSRSNFPA